MSPPTRKSSPALGLSSSIVTGMTRTGDQAAFGTFSSLGVITPIAGSRFLAMSSGVAGTSSPEVGTDFPPGGAAGDAAELRITLTVPDGVQRLEFFYRFMSAEYPEWVGSSFNDDFTVRIISGGISTEVARATVNSAPFYPASKGVAGGSGTTSSTAVVTPTPD